MDEDSENGHRLTRALQQMMRLDEKTWAKCRTKNIDFQTKFKDIFFENYNAASVHDFVLLKTKEFLEMQTMLNSMDHNSLNSERASSITTRVDHMMKEIALSSRKKYSRLADEDGKQLFDIV